MSNAEYPVYSFRQDAYNINLTLQTGAKIVNGILTGYKQQNFIDYEQVFSLWVHTFYSWQTALHDYYIDRGWPLPQPGDAGIVESITGIANVPASRVVCSARMDHMRYYTSRNDSMQVIQNARTHELGHFIGMLHNMSSSSTSVMVVESADSIPREFLEPHDYRYFQLGGPPLEFNENTFIR